MRGLLEEQQGAVAQLAAEIARRECVLAHLEARLPLVSRDRERVLACVRYELHQLRLALAALTEEEEDDK